MIFLTGFYSIKKKLLFVFTLNIVLAMFVITLLAFLSSKENIISNSKTANEAYLLTTATQVNGYVDNYIDVLLAIKKRIESMPLYQTKDFNSLEQYFAKDLQIIKESSNTLAVYLGFPDGTMLVSDADSDKQNKNFRKRGGGISSYDNPEYDSTSRAWYKGAIANNGIFVSDVYEDSVTRLPSFTYSVPIIKEGRLVAVLGIDLLLTPLQQNFEKLPGKVFVFDTTSSIPFASSDKSIILKQYPSISKIMQHYKDVGDYKTFEYLRADQTKKFGICTRINNSKAKINYIACAVQEQESLEKAINQSAYTQIFISIVISIISCFIAYMILVRMFSPIQKIQTGLNSFFDFINHKTK
uniref:cache domain-containing protein n=1 Tax=Campylobacter sp. TaxID=205 RepID=UPI0025B86C87